jgi:hypothetical protein
MPRRTARQGGARERQRAEMSGLDFGAEVGEIWASAKRAWPAPRREVPASAAGVSRPPRNAAFRARRPRHAACRLSVSPAPPAAGRADPAHRERGHGPIGSTPSTAAPCTVRWPPPYATLLLRPASRRAASSRGCVVTCWGRLLRAGARTGSRTPTPTASPSSSRRAGEAAPRCAVPAWRASPADVRPPMRRLGCYTDDTQMTLALAQSIAQQGRCDAEDAARQYAARYEPHRWGPPGGARGRAVPGVPGRPSACAADSAAGPA